MAQFYDRDTTAPMAEAGMSGIMKFLDKPSDIDTILKDMEVERARDAAAGQ